MAYGIPIAELQQRMTAHEFAELCAYSRLEPFGERRADARIAYAFARLANMLTGRRVRVRDFIADIEPKPAGNLLQRWKAFVTLHNATVDGNDRKPSR